MVVENHDEAAPAVASEQVPTDDMKWYIVHTYSGYERPRCASL